MNLASTPLQIQWFEKTAKGKAESVLSAHQRGRVCYQGTSWPARFHDEESSIIFAVGDAVAVVGRQGNTLLITDSDVNDSDVTVSQAKPRRWFWQRWGSAA